MIITESFNTQMQYIEAVRTMTRSVEEVVSENVDTPDNPGTSDPEVANETNEDETLIEENENEVVE